FASRPGAPSTLAVRLRWSSASPLSQTSCPSPAPTLTSPRAGCRRRWTVSASPWTPRAGAMPRRIERRARRAWRVSSPAGRRQRHMPDTDPDVLLRVDDVVKHFPIRQGIFFKRQIGAVRAVDGVSLEVRRGETLGLVGETG